jgi:hypothetical protein
MDISLLVGRGGFAALVAFLLEDGRHAICFILFYFGLKLGSFLIIAGSCCCCCCCVIHDVCALLIVLDAFVFRFSFFRFLVEMRTLREY